MRSSELTIRPKREWLPSAWLALDEAGRFFDLSQTACDYLGYSRDELLQLDIHSVEPEFDSTHIRGTLDCSTGRTVYRTGVHRCKSGEALPVEMCVTGIQCPGSSLLVIWIRHTKPNGGADLPLGQELDLVLRWADDLAHRMNNLLTIVQVHASYLLGEKPLDTDSIESVREIYDAVGRAAQLTGQIASVAQRRDQKNASDREQ